MPLLLCAQNETKPKPKKAKIQADLDGHVTLPDETKPDFSKESLFKGIFQAGLNLAQVDGDAEFGYRKFGANVGVGTYVKFHRRMSISLEMIYSMKGARPRYSTYDASGKKNFFDITTDYLEIPVSFNVHDKRIVMVGAGLSFGALLRYEEHAVDTISRDLTNTAAGTVIQPPFGAPSYKFQPPAKFELAGQIHASFIIKEQFSIGIRFSYSFLKIRDAVNQTKIKGQYNNVITIRFAYLLDPKKMKLRKR